MYVLFADMLRKYLNTVSQKHVVLFVKIHRHSSIFFNSLTIYLLCSKQKPLRKSVYSEKIHFVPKMGRKYFVFRVDAFSPCTIWDVEQYMKNKIDLFKHLGEVLLVDKLSEPNGENSKESSNACVEMMSHEIIYKPALHVGVTSSCPFKHVTVVEGCACRIQCIATSQVTVTIEPLVTVPVGSMMACSTLICSQSEIEKSV